MRYLLVISIFFYSFSTSAQYRRERPVMEVMAGAGMPVVFGDIGKFGMGPVFRAGFRYRFDNNMSVSSSLIASYVSGSDANSRNETRGLSYKTLILEPTAQFEYFFFQERRGFGSMGRLITVPRIRPYVFAGAGVLYYNPVLEGVNLSSVTTDYSKFTWTAIGGAGLIYSINQEWLLSGELGGRFLTVDYIDGYSSSASTANDLYYMGTLSAIYRWKYNPYKRR